MVWAVEGEEDKGTKMPAGDGTGPDGRGGWCTPLWQSGKIERPEPFYGRGFGRGFGRGMARGFGRFAAMRWERNIESDEKEYAKNEVEALEEELEYAKKRLKELEKK
jgi:hypothetical protein